MNSIYLALYILSAVCFLFGILPVPTRVNLIALGLLCWVMVPLLELANRLT